MPVESMLIGNLHADMPSKEESFAIAIGSAPLLLGDLRNLSTADQHWYAQKIAWFKALRSRVRISESFFSLGDWMQPNSERWDGFARLARTGEGIIVLFRNDATADHADVRLPVMPDGLFTIKSVVSGARLGTFGKGCFAEWRTRSFPRGNVSGST